MKRYLLLLCCLNLCGESSSWAASLQARPSRHYAHTLAADASLLEKVKGTIQKRLQTDFDQPLRVELTSHTSTPRQAAASFKEFEVKQVHFDPHHKGFISDVRFMDAQGQEYLEKILGRVIFMKNVPVFKEALLPGEMLQLQQLTWKVVEDDYRLRHVITKPEFLEGAILKERVQPGDMPRLKNLKTNRGIEKGDIVELIYRGPRLFISLPGAKVLAKGRIGETVPISHTMARSGKIIFGVVESNRRVRISSSGS